MRLPEVTVCFGVKESVIDFPADPATRSLNATLFKVIVDSILPEALPGEEAESLLVETVIPVVLPEVDDPMVTPPRVTENSVFWAKVVAVVSITEVAPKAETAERLLCAGVMVGVTPPKKNPLG
jgi:hypothetical protein